MLVDAAPAARLARGWTAAAIPDTTGIRIRTRNGGNAAGVVVVDVLVVDPEILAEESFLAVFDFNFVLAFSRSIVSGFLISRLMIGE